MIMREAIKVYKTFGGHFFDNQTIMWWNSRIETELYPNRCFVTSEPNFYGEKRKYTIRRFSFQYDDVETIGEFRQYDTLHEASVEAAKVKD